MTTEELNAIRERADKSAVGEWVYNRDENEILCGSYTIARDFEYEADAVFIGKSREDIPVLLAEVERLQKRLLELGEYRCVLDYENVKDDGTFNEHAYEYFDEEESE